MKKLRLFVAATLLLAAVLLLAACGGGAQEPNGDVSSIVSSAVSTYTYTGTAGLTSASAPAESTAPPVTTAPVVDDSPLSEAELEDFLALVDYEKVSRVQVYYYNYYVGTFRSVEECTEEIFDTITEMKGIRTVTDTEGATGVFIDVYVRLMGDYYGYYYPPTDYSDYTDDINGEYTGIGVSVLVDKDGYAEILNVFPGSPAEAIRSWRWRARTSPPSATRTPSTASAAPRARP